jgi:2-methylcitrate dehydratase PrpD
VAETRGLSGAAMLTAFALGAEIECRVGNMVTGGHYARGWHITATCGVFGAALAAGHLMNLGADKLAHAMGIAASASGGIAENLPTEAKNVGVGNAAKNGLLAALFAAEGYDAAPRAIEGRQGWARAAGDEPMLEELLGGLGQRWELLANTYKPYPAGIVMHAIIDACLELRGQHGIVAEANDTITVAGDALLHNRGDRIIGNARDSRVSIHHAAAVPFLWGRAGTAEFSDPKAMSAEAMALRARVRPERDDGLPQGAARVVVRMKDGRSHTATVLAARGSIDKPLTDAELEAKVASCAAESGTGLDAGRIAEAVWRLDREPDVNGLLAATVVRKA